MDSPFKDGDPPKLTDEHRYQIGDTPVYLSIANEAGKPRLSFVITHSPSGVKFEPPVRAHLATFVSDGHALSTVEFLDELVSNVNKAIEHYAKLSAPDVVTLLERIKQEPNRVQQN
jgi:hypothetical protein